MHSSKINENCTCKTKKKMIVIIKVHLASKFVFAAAKNSFVPDLVCEKIIVICYFLNFL